jgi:hypothetical protein
VGGGGGGGGVFIVLFIKVLDFFLFGWGFVVGKVEFILGIFEGRRGVIF